MIFSIGEKVRYIGTTYTFLTGEECEVVDIDFDQNLKVTDYSLRPKGFNTIFVVGPTHIEALETQIPPIIPGWMQDKSYENTKIPAAVGCPHKNKVTRYALYKPFLYCPDCKKEVK